MSDLVQELKGHRSDLIALIARLEAFEPTCDQRACEVIAEATIGSLRCLINELDDFMHSGGTTLL